MSNRVNVDSSDVGPAVVPLFDAPDQAVSLSNRLLTASRTVFTPLALVCLIYFAWEARATLSELISRSEPSRLAAAGVSPQQQRPPTSGEKTLDDEFAKKVAVPWAAAGGSADAIKNLGQIKAVISELESNPSLTGGTYLANAPDAALRMTNPDALSARERVEEVVQRNLREILGAQFRNAKASHKLAGRSDICSSPGSQDRLNQYRLRVPR